MSNRDIIAIGGSAGSLAVLRQIFADLPSDLPAAVFIVRHVAEGSDNLAAILAKAGPLAVKTAEDGDLIEPRRAYVAPSSHHLLVEKGVIRLGRGPRENMARPSADPLMRSAALAYGPRAIGVVLTGMLYDGAAGLATIKRCGGLTIVQDPVGAEAADMPNNALSLTDIDYRFPADRLGQALSRLVLEEAPPPPGPVPADVAWEVAIARGRPGNTAELAQFAKPVALSCPACSGVLSQVADPDVLRFRCQIGHAYSTGALDSAQAEAVEEALGVALRILEERHTLLMKMAENARRRGQNLSSQTFEKRAGEYRAQADAIRKAVLGDLA